MTVGAIEAVVVTAATLFLIVARPRNLNEGFSALLGAAAVLVLGLVSPATAVLLEWNNWNIFLFFLGMMGVAALADQSGVFDAVASLAARWSRGRIAALYLAVFLLGSLISLLFANDSAALVLTPIVYALVVRLNLDPLPFVFATTFIADSASIGLPVSNPLNVIVADNFHLGLGSYIGHLWLSAVIVVLINIAAFFVIFHRSIGGRFPLMKEVRRPPGLASTAGILGALALAYLAASALQWPLGPVSLAGFVVLGLNLRRLGRLDLPRLRGDISWPIFLFIGGMFVVVQSLDASGVTSALGRELARAAGTNSLRAIAVSTVGTAVGSNLINNLPMSLVMVHAVGPLHISAQTRLDMIYGTVLGCDLGPNLTHLGSLATFIWLFFLRRKGLDVSTWDYFRIGVLVTPIMLLGAIGGLWLTSQWI